MYLHLTQQTEHTTMVCQSVVYTCTYVYQMYVIVNDDPRGATQYFYNHN